MSEVIQRLKDAQPVIDALGIRVRCMPVDVRSQQFGDLLYEEVTMHLCVGEHEYYRSQRIRGHEAEHAKHILTGMVRDLVCIAMGESWPVS